MDTLAGYIATFCVGATGTYASQLLAPKIKIKFWMSHQFMYTIPNNQLNPGPVAIPALPATGGVRPPTAPQPPNFLLLTQSVTIQNFGRQRADWIEIVHRRKPDFF